MKNNFFLLVFAILFFFLQSFSLAAYASKNNTLEQVDIIYIDEMNIIKEKLLSWANSWSNGDINKYLDFYVSNYAPKGQNHKKWLKQRKQKVKKNKHIIITIMLEDISLNGEANKAQTIFWQSYKSNTYQDKVKKKIVWQKNGAVWLIESEHVVDE